MKFLDKLDGAIGKNRSLVCVGLDPDPGLMPPGVSVFDFNREIIAATSDLVCAYKLNLAFYEALGEEGLDALRRSVKLIPANVLSIGDGKRGDIGNTARAYARAIFEVLGFDAATVSPYLGGDSVEPFTRYEEKGSFILCRTSNPGALDFQSLKCEAGAALYQAVAAKASQWNTKGNIGLVVGATYPDELKIIRESHPEMPLLIPGIGAQQGDLALAVRYGTDKNGGRALINSSRQIIYASRGEDFAAAARRAAAELRERINSFRGV